MGPLSTGHSALWEGLAVVKLHLILVLYGMVPHSIGNSALWMCLALNSTYISDLSKVFIYIYYPNKTIT